MEKYKFVNAIFHVLFLHKGPVLEFNVCFGDLEMGFEFDPVILCLSKIINLKTLLLLVHFIARIRMFRTHELTF